jgi:hypothetical protein
MFGSPFNFSGCSQLIFRPKGDTEIIYCVLQAYWKVHIQKYIGKHFINHSAYLLLLNKAKKIAMKRGVRIDNSKLIDIFFD